MLTGGPADCGAHRARDAGLCSEAICCLSIFIISEELFGRMPAHHVCNRCQGQGYREQLFAELRRREAAAGIKPDPALDAFCRASTRDGKRHNVVTDLTLRLLGLEVCAGGCHGPRPCGRIFEHAIHH